MRAIMDGVLNNKIFRIGLPIVLIGLIVLVFGMDLTKGASKNNQNYFISINGIDIPKEEFRMFLQDEKASVSNYFYKKYGAEYSEDFWETKYADEIPIYSAKTIALNQLLKVKVEQELAVEYGVLESPLFKEIKQELKKQETKYGAESLDLFQEYMTFHSKMVLETMDKFKVKSNAIKEKELKRFYDENKLDLFKAPDELAILLISLVDVDEDRKDEFIANVVQDVKEGSSIENLNKKYADQYQFAIQDKRYGSNEGKDENSSELEAMLKEQAYMLNTDEVSEPIQYGNRHFIIVCKKRTEGKVKEYDVVKNAIENLLQERKFEDKVKSKIQDAEISIDESKYDHFQMK